MPEQQIILLQTKLHRPHMPVGLLKRSRLLDLLDKNIDNPLILICAPAGFGKTTLIGTWLEKMAENRGKKAASLPCAWISLDENDGDFYLFLGYFVAAVRTVFNDACLDTLGLLQARQQTPVEVLFTTLSNDLDKLPGEFILVLDDYHSIHGKEVHNLLTELIRHWPKSLHLVLISRISPPIPLVNLRAKGMVCEIRTRDLRFTPDETATYLDPTNSNQIMGKNLPLLEERFEGWPAGLHLATLSLRSETSQDSILSALSKENTNITGYLVDEVLKQQTPVIQTFLLKTSILDRFCVSICETIIPGIDPTWDMRACLDWVEQAELFLIPLDNKGEWYRYHPLFQDLLRRRLSLELSDDRVADLHRRASSWFEGHGLSEEALQHALTAGDLDLVAHLMYTGLRDVVNREDRPTLERWQRLLTDEMIMRHPELLMLKVWVLQFSWRLNLQSQVIERLEMLMDSAERAPIDAHDLKILRGQTLLIKAQYAYFCNQSTQSIDFCRQVLELLPPEWTFVRGGSMLYLGLSLQASGQSSVAERLLLDEFEIYENKNDIYDLFLLQSLCYIYLKTNQLDQVIQTAHLLHQLANSGGFRLMKYWGDWFLGVVHYQRDELDAAARHFTQIVENPYIAQISSYRDAIAGMALIHQIKGESSKSQLMMESISKFDLEQSGSEDNRTRSLHARLMLLQGNLEGASRWADAFTDLPPDQPLMWLEEPQITRARILIAKGKRLDLQLAMQILDALDEITDRTHNLHHKLEVLSLRALALEGQGETSLAENALQEAVNLARIGSLIRIFLDLGKPMQSVLQRLAKKEDSNEMIFRILAAFPEDDKNPVRIESPSQQTHLISLKNSKLSEPLTPRELEVVNYLSGPLSINEIAGKLNISYATAKRHTINLYSKLGVNQRRDAVARAMELGILLPR
jgi:LuxR family maltose regulon positive regulatory protein